MALSPKASSLRFIAWLCAATFLGAAVRPVSTAGQSAALPDVAAEVQAIFEQIVALRLDGEYDRAVETLNDLIAKYQKPEEVLRRAYHHLVTVYVQNGDEEGAKAAARAALEHFPDLRADELEFPGGVNDVYEQMRKEMFGAFVIKQPKECRVYMDSTYVGETPLALNLVRVKEYGLTVTKSGYKDYVSRIEIQPERTLDLSGLALERNRAWWWWPAWVGGAAVAAVAVAIGVSGDEEGSTDEPDPLPGPPSPPSN